MILGIRINIVVGRRPDDGVLVDYKLLQFYFENLFNTYDGEATNVTCRYSLSGSSNEKPLRSFSHHFFTFIFFISINFPVHGLKL